MRSVPRLMASAVVGGLVLLCSAAAARAQVGQMGEPVSRIASMAPGAIQGRVQDEKGAPIVGAMVSALGATTAFTVTDRGGRFELGQLSPGPYLVRAHLGGFIASRGQIIDVRPSTRVSSSIALQRTTSAPPASYPIVNAGLGAPVPADSPPAPPSSGDAGAPAAGDDDHGEVAWRLRHARRGILKDATATDGILADEAPAPDTNVFEPTRVFGRAVSSPARVASDFFAGTPFSGQVNLLTTGSFDSPLQLFSADSFSRSIAYFAVTAPIGAHADWTVRGAMTQGDLPAWVVAGSYTVRAPARHRYDIGLSYANQTLESESPAVLTTAADGGRTAGSLYGFDTFAVTPAVTVTYGGRYARYDYLDERGLLSPRVALTVAPDKHLRVNAIASRRALAPGAEEFVQPADAGIWIPPQRTFSSLDPDRTLQAERTTHLEVEVERDLGRGTTFSVRGFRQHVDDQLVTLFGIDAPRGPSTDLGRYFIANNGEVDIAGWSAGLRGAFANRLHGSIDYSVSRANWSSSADSAYLILVAPSALRGEPERIHDLNTALETDVPETSTRVILIYRVSNAFAHSLTGTDTAPASDRPSLDYRFDVQVRQSLPFMDFSSAKWEMLVAVRNFFREMTPDQSTYDELLVVHPPKRIVGGLTLHF